MGRRREAQASLSNSGLADDPLSYPLPLCLLRSSLPEDCESFKLISLSPFDPVEPIAGLDTTYDVVQYAARTRPNKNAFGTRTITDIVTETKEVTKIVDGVEKKEQKEWKYFQLSEYKCQSFFLSLGGSPSWPPDADNFTSLPFHHRDHLPAVCRQGRAPRYGTLGARYGQARRGRGEHAHHLRTDEVRGSGRPF